MATTSAEGDGSAINRAAPWTDRLYIVLLGLSVLGVMSQITLGGVVRVTGSGDGCPDWPRCFGKWYPPADYHAILEWSHRTTGTLVGIIMFLVLVRTIQKYRDDRGLLWLALSGFVLVGIVGIIGGQVVLNELDPAIRTLHLGLAELVMLTMIAALVLAATRPSLRAFSMVGSVDGRIVAKLATLAALVALVALLSGAYAVWRNAGAVCGSWPLCGGPILPEITVTVIHMSHRLLAGLSILLAAYAAYRAYRLQGADTMLKAATIMVGVVVVAQMLVGAANPWSDFDTWAKASHLSLATVMLAATSLVAIMIWLTIYRDSREKAERHIE